MEVSDLKFNKGMFKHVMYQLQCLIQKEADLIMSYQELINQVKSYYAGDMDESELRKYNRAISIICKSVEPNISDSLRHQEDLAKLYSVVSGVKVKDD